MIRRPPRSTLDRSSAASDVYKRQEENYSWSAYNIEFLDFGEQVGASHIWANEGNGIFTVSTFFSSFNSNWDINYRKEPFVDKYLPLKLKFGDDIYYGFVRLSIKTFGSHFFTGAYSATGSPLTIFSVSYNACLLYTSDAADERSSVDLGGRRIIKKNNSLVRYR